MALATILGYPRIGVSRELKSALERHWSGELSEEELQKTAQDLRATHWQNQTDAGIDLLPSNDFSFYDLMLDTSCLVGAIPRRFDSVGGGSNATYFAMARGLQSNGIDAEACEMTKWFDTNYHYIVPEFSVNQKFALSSTKPFDEFAEARSMGVKTRPVLIGPLSFLALGKGFSPNNLDLLDKLLPVYGEVVERLGKMGAEWIQFDEPILATDIDDAQAKALDIAYGYLRSKTSANIFLTSYFGPMRANLDLVFSLPIEALHLDLVRGRQDVDDVLSRVPSYLILSLGVVDGRNIWRNNLEMSLQTLEKVAGRIGIDRIWVSSSCSLLHCPYDLDRETALDGEIKNWMAFGKQKMNEIAVLTKGLNQGRTAIASHLQASDAAIAARSASTRLHNPEVASRVASQPLERAGRYAAYPMRSVAQQVKLNLPLFPTTTIGSFPQTADVRRVRSDFKKDKISQAEYDAFIKDQIKKLVAFQNEVGLDVLVHGEFERNDMVEYFGEKLNGFCFTKNGWVQSYGSRCVKPPVIYGDVSRDTPMTVAWSVYAQSLSDKPMKGMLTGPITILQWSFVRDDQPRSVTAHQIALALQDEVLDLERAGIGVIQIDEPAFREGLPLRRADWRSYLTWATQAFRLSSTGVKDETQIHTHMCYSEFNDIISWIKELDADVISVEASRSKMELLDAFIDFHYPNAIGPGVYDIHSPRVPSEAEMVSLLESASRRLDDKQLWANPDCGLKTRGWPEVQASLQNLVAAAQRMRASHRN